MSIAWLLAAIGLALAGGSRAATASRRLAIAAPTRRRLAGGAVAIGCLALFGWEQGALAGAVGVPLVLAALRRAERLPARARPSPELALLLDLVAVALRAGQPLDRALVLAAGVDERGCGAAIVRVGRLLRLGAAPAEAWAVVTDDPALAAVAAAGVRSAASGMRLAAEFEQVAADMRAQLQSAASARAAKAGVLVAAPLGLCFLPSFVCLGIVPTVVGVAGSVLT
jgi:pilus assembly protein TadC